MWATLFEISLCLGLTFGYSTGPPSSVCEGMTPSPSFHGSPQTGVCPYTVTMDKTTYSAGETVTVTLAGASGETFKGFFIEPRPSRDVYRTLGTFNTPTLARNPCVDNGNEKDTGLTHNSGTPKSNMVITWTAPSNYQGDIVFVYTVVQTKQTFWVKQVSGTLKYQAPTGPTESTQSTTTQSTRQPQSTQSTAQATITKDSNCGDTVGCFHECEGEDCNFLLTWMDNGDNVDISLTCKRAGNAWCAIGLSGDEKMGDDSVFECVSNGGVASAYVSYNFPEKYNQRLDNNVFGLTVTSTSHVDGVLQCVFSRKKTAALAQSSTGRKKREVQSDASTFFDMNSDWYLLYAYGSSNGGVIFKHSVLPKVSSQKADFQSMDDIGASDIKNTSVRVHGILMVVAWMLNATLGIFMARFYKTVWPEGSEWCGDKRWFVLHRILMISTFCLTVAGIIVIFVHVEGWAQIVGSGFQKSHPIIGVVVAGLALINPIMAAFRPHPGTPKRPLFKAGHSLVGVGAYVCAIVNVFSGTMLPAAHIPDYIRYILYVFCGWTFLIEMSLHIYECTKRDGKRGEAYEMKPTSDSSRGGSKSEVDNVKVGFMVVHWLVVIGLAASVCIVIGVAENHDH